MESYRTAIMFSFFMFLLIGCSFGIKSYKEMGDLFTANEQDVVITLERTVCLGPCPSYRLAVYGDGTVIYEGREYVKKRKRIISKISKEKVAELIQAFEKIDHLNYPNGKELYKNCEVYATDNPTVITSLRINDRYKRIEYYHGYYRLDGEELTLPSELKVLRDLEDKIDLIVNTKQWTE